MKSMQSHEQMLSPLFIEMMRYKKFSAA